VLSVPGVGAHACAAGEHGQCLGPDLFQAELLGDREGRPGMGVTLVQLPAAGEASGELEIQDGGGAHGAHLLGGAPRLGQPLHPRVVEQVDGAEFVQGAHPPQRQARGFCGDERALERLGPFSA